MPGPYSVMLQAGQKSALFNISITNDEIRENVETFMIAINSSSLPNGIIIANPAQAAQADTSQTLVRIVDDDSKL